MTVTKFSRRQWIAAASATLIAGGLPSIAIGRNSADTLVRRWRQYVGPAGSQVHFHSAAPVEQPKVRRRPLLCLQPSPSSGAFFREFQDLMATDRWVLCADTPGFGSSDPPNQLPNIGDYAKAIAGAMDALGFGRDDGGPVDVLGFHTGCLIAAEIAATRPDLVRRLVLPGIPFYEGKEQEEAYARNAKEKAYFSDPKLLGDDVNERVDWVGEATGNERLLEILGEELRGGRNNWWAYHAVFRYPARERFARVTQKTLVVATGGELMEASENAAEILPNATLKKFPQYGAPLFHKYPREMAQLTRQFLDA